jgi:hypothetical protein
MTKPRKPLQVRAGRFKTRDGRLATVSLRVGGDWPWRGSIGGVDNVRSWTDEGFIACAGCKQPGDLVKRLPDEKPKPPRQRKAGMQWGVFFPMWDKRNAQKLLTALRSGGIIPLSMKPLMEVRRLPAQKPAGRGR